MLIGTILCYFTSRQTSPSESDRILLVACKIGSGAGGALQSSKDERHANQADKHCFTLQPATWILVQQFRNINVVPTSACGIFAPFTMQKATCLSTTCHFGCTLHHQSQLVTCVRAHGVPGTATTAPSPACCSGPGAGAGLLPRSPRL